MTTLRTKSPSYVRRKFGMTVEELKTAATKHYYSWIYRDEEQIKEARRTLGITRAQAVNLLTIRLQTIARYRRPR